MQNNLSDNTTRDTNFKFTTDTWRQLIDDERWGDFYSSYNTEAPLIFPNFCRNTQHFPRHRLWEGQRYERLVVCANQGAGDVIMWSRFLKELDPVPIFLVYPDLAPLLEHQFFVDHCRTTGLPRYYDFWVPMTAVPAILGLTGPHPGPYLHTHQKYDIQHEKPNIGICWAGQVKYANDLFRSIPLKDFKPFFENDNYRYISLMKDTRKRIYSDKDGKAVLERDLVEHPAEWSIFGANDKMKTWDDTASLINSLDAVVTCDTAVAHVAGFLGVTTALLLPFNAEWRWGTKDTTAWYPSMKLFRQKQPHDWAEAMKHAYQWIHGIFNKSIK